MLKAFFVLEIIIFLSRLISFVERRLDKKTKVNFKIHDFADWTTNITILILTNISRSKGN